jgi:acetyl esterase/lipase
VTLRVLALAVAVTLASGLSVSACGGDDDDDFNLDRKPKDSELADWGGPSEVPLGVLILLPGGGWERPSDTAYENYQRQAERANEAGYATVVLRYSAGAKALGEVERIYSEARKYYPGSGICAVGGSAGGHLALMLAAREPNLTCVVAQSAPTDLTHVAEQGSPEGQKIADEAFGKDRLAELSPIGYAKDISAPVLLIYAEADPIVPLAQGEEMARRLPKAELITLPDGVGAWLHGPADPAAVTSALEREVAFLQDTLRTKG